MKDYTASYQEYDGDGVIYTRKEVPIWYIDDEVQGMCISLTDLGLGKGGTQIIIDIDTIVGLGLKAAHRARTRRER